MMLIAKYEPTAKKHREDDEKSTKKALEDSKIKQPRKPTIVAGKGDKEDNSYSSGSNPYDYYPYSGGYSPPSYSPSSYGNDAASPSAYQPPTPPSGSSGSRGGSSSTPHDEKDKGDKKDKEDKGETTKGPRIESKQEKKVNTLIDELEDALEQAIDAIKDAQLNKLDQQIVISETAAQNKKITSAIEEANLYLEQTFAPLKRLKKLSLNSEQKKSVEKTYAKQKSLLKETLESINKLSTLAISSTKKKDFKLEKQPEIIKHDEADVKKTKEVKESLEEIAVEEKPLPAESPYLLAENIVKFQKAYDSLISK